MENNIEVQTSNVIAPVKLFEYFLIWKEKRVPTPPSVLIRDSELAWECKSSNQESSLDSKKLNLAAGWLDAEK